MVGWRSAARSLRGYPTRDLCSRSTDFPMMDLIGSPENLNGHSLGVMMEWDSGVIILVGLQSVILIKFVSKARRNL